MVLEDLEDVVELLAGLLETRGGGELGDRRRVADARDDVLTLGVDEEVAVALVGAVGRVARERDAGGGGVTLVAEGHDLHVDGSAEVVGNLVLLAIEDGALGVPGSEDCLLRETKLEDRVGGEDGLAVDLDLGVLLDVDVVGEDLLELGDEVLEVVSVELGVELHALLLFERIDELLEVFLADLHNDVGIHLDKSSVAVPSPTGIAGFSGDNRNTVFVKTEVKDCVHHTGH